ncbi:PREDICTED: kinesin-like protein subito [Nicrophorus vespilloides]|uniref:Kinesin-like protein n=1 Tax=Nicrophorus vespilloides TaxID=110193 RepID=A0ABM1MBB0_NICVS|nr:PREDICTED: kinesin-like protein subito [Nicrophorus vespilloides]
MNMEPPVRDIKISYLRARDPSIMAWGGMNIENVKCNLQNMMNETHQENGSDNSIQVYLRIKNGELGDLYHMNSNILVCNIPQNCHANRHAKDGQRITRKFTFSRIFPPDSTQPDIFNAVVKPRIFNFINGVNCTLLTYGASGSGKTFTIVGSGTEPGLIPRALEYVFKTLPKMPVVPEIKPTPSGIKCKRLTHSQSQEEVDILYHLMNDSNASTKQMHTKTYHTMQQRLSTEPVATLEDVGSLSLGIWVSFAEIYNEQVFDLLQTVNGKVRKNLKLCNNNGITFIKELKQIYVSSGLEAYQILQLGLQNLKYASTSVNSHSSRSHCIFTLKLIQVGESDNDICVSHFNFCDLAGSERSKKTNNVGDRLKESNNINNSLLVLSRCMSMMRNAQRANEKKLVPFRESKLTQLFQRALCGQEDIAMIVNMNPIPDMFDETMHVLNFSAIAKDIIVEQQLTKKDRLSRNMEKINSEEIVEIERLRDTVSSLILELQDEKMKSIETDKETRSYLIKEFSKMMDDIKEEYENKIENYECQIEDLNEECGRLSKKRRRSEAANTSIICLDNSDVGHQNLELINLQHELKKMKEKNASLEERVKYVEEELRDATAEIAEKKSEISSQAAQIISMNEEISTLEALVRNNVATTPELSESDTDDVDL